MKVRNGFSLLSVILLLAACGTAENAASGDSSSADEFTVKATEAETTEGDFIYRLVSEKEEYPSGGPVEIYAELEYIGEEAGIDIFHAGSAFFFPMEEKTRGFQLDYPMNEPLLMTTLTKDEPLREKYSGSGGYSEQDDAAYIEFTKQVMNNQFPEGYYVVNGFADFYTETPTGDKTEYQIRAEIDFKVVD
ncbi:hypothetical protein [Planococcus sp. CAU13]|uniref:hypothetical protein n=1 Tax=Planococcus sp. CAU13 TaxID=1541197 RepID=UPI00052FEEDB|nr:hypothetical protein [Planococcus sp. CAU13]